MNEQKKEIPATETDAYRQIGWTIGALKLLKSAAYDLKSVEEYHEFQKVAEDLLERNIKRLEEAQAELKEYAFTRQ